ncbi:MAG: lysine biosynthesis protein LysX [Thermoproteota archaeon]|nr:lysine biosynthesis protein LysX [Thermoproteota archaeon]MDQ5859436.1 lysine biosynthesis protein LysX [Thermoproteota archaeon]
MVVEVSILCDKVRFEEKALYEKTQSIGIKSKIVDAKTLSIGTCSKARDLQLGDVILQRSVSYYRGLYLTACLEFLGFKVINRFEVGQVCGNKLTTSIRLAENKIPTPKTQFAFSAESGLETIKNTGFPVVLKPVVGSWGRGIYPLRDLETASMIIEMREEDDSPLSRIYYIQEMVDRPSRDIRCIVIGDQVLTAIYRYSSQSEWRTNVALGGKVELAPITKEMEDLALRAAKAVGGGILGVDMMEDKNRGLVVHEVNNTVEFRGAASVSKADIPNQMIDYAVNIARK